MKHICLRILAVIWLALLLLFSAFILALNFLLPKHFQSLAEESLRYEMTYVDRLIRGEETPEYEETPFGGNIFYVLLPDGGTSAEDPSSDNVSDGQGSLSGLQTAQSEVEQYCLSHDLTKGECYTFRTQSGFYVLAEYDDLFGSELRPTAIYINLQFIFQYTQSMLFMLGLFFFCLTAVMSAIGFRLGKGIEQAQEVQRHFFQNSSHELKTPLMAIQGYAEGIQQGVMEPAASAAVILQESDRMTGLVEELLTLSRIDAKRMELHPAPTELQELLYDCLRATEPIWRKKHMEVCPVFAEEPVMALGDEDALTRALKNILVNAIRHGRKRVELFCEACGAEAVVRIADDGGGIAREDLSHVFDRFYTGQKGSTGIGLALAAEIVHLHKGSIAAQNGEQGAVFEIRLPLAKEKLTARPKRAGIRKKLRGF